MSFLRARVVEAPGGEPRWVEVPDQESAIKMTDTFVYRGWHRLNFYQDGTLITAVRPNPSDFGAPMILALIPGEKEKNNA